MDDISIMHTSISNHISTVATTTKVAAETILPYDSFKNILLLGEADFSFTKAFAKEFLYTNKSKNNIVVDDFIKGNDKKQRNDSNLSTTPQMKITATEYGNGEDIANRYFNGDQKSVIDAMNSLLDLDPVKEIICCLNARNLGEVNVRKKKLVKQACDSRDSNKNWDEIQNTRRDEEANLESCTCQRWNVNLNKWDDQTPFWDSSWKNDELYGNTYDLIIFNFPHSDQAGRATKLVKALFKQLRFCIDDGKLGTDVVLEMRLRTIETDPKQRRNIRSYYNHEESAKESGFACIGCWPGDLERWEKFGYRHKMTKKNETCLDIGSDCKVWRWKSSN